MMKSRAETKRALIERWRQIHLRVLRLGLYIDAAAAAPAVKQSLTAQKPSHAIEVADLRALCVRLRNAHPRKGDRYVHGVCDGLGLAADALSEMLDEAEAGSRHGG